MSRGWGQALFSDRTRGNRHKLQHTKFYLNIRKNCFTLRVTEPWNRLPREAVGSPSLEMFRVTWMRLSAACSRRTCFSRGLDWMVSRGPFQH